MEVKLTEKGFSDKEIEKTIQKLKENKLLDDRRFTGAWIRQRNQFSPRGIFLLKRELQQKGVSEEDIENGLCELEKQEEPIHETELAIEAGRRKLKVYHNLNGEVFRRRLAGFLARRGFGYSVIKIALDKLEKER